MKYSQNSDVRFLDFEKDCERKSLDDCPLNVFVDFGEGFRASPDTLNCFVDAENEF